MNKIGLRLLLGALAVLLVLMGAGAWYSFVQSPNPGDALSLDRVVSLAGKGQVLSANFLDEDALVEGRYCSVTPTPGQACPNSEQRDYHAYYLRSDAATAQLQEKLQASGASTTVDHQNQKGLIRFLTQFVLPLMILANLFGLIFVAISGGGSIGDVIGFGRIRRRQRPTTGVTFADVAGADEAVAELREVRDYLLDPNRYRDLGAVPPKGVLLFGPPGCGKTLLARAVAGESGVPFFSMSGAEFVESLVGVGAARVRDLFAQAQASAPAIIFIDELDAVARRRTFGGGQGGTDEREQTLNQMLVAMDGFDVSAGIVVMAATNRPDILDPALLRPGRFDRHVTVDEPDLRGREAILAVHARGKPLGPEVELSAIAQRTPGFTGADLANVVNEAAILAIRDGRRMISMEEMTESIQRVLHGPKRRGHLMSNHERQRVAQHESGHAVVAAAMGRADAVHRVSITARGRGLGLSFTASDQEKVLHTRSEIEAEMVMLMGGLAAEEVTFGEPSTAGESDVEKVTFLARRMIGQYGMSTEMGPLRLMGRVTDAYLDEEGPDLVQVSPRTLELFDAEVRRAADLARDRAVRILRSHQATLDRLAARLLEVETLDGEELEAMLVPARPAARRAAASPSRPGARPAAARPARRR
ncbi:MAG: ATP-dependent zinc metalloprotease FtsH [Candidatus Dormibacteria bacterium]